MLDVKSIKSDRDIYYFVSEDNDMRVVKNGLDENIENLVFYILNVLKEFDYPTCTSLKMTYTDYISSDGKLIEFKFNILSFIDPVVEKPFIRVSSLREARNIRFANIGKIEFPLNVVLFFSDEELYDKDYKEEEVAELSEVD